MLANYTHLTFLLDRSGSMSDCWTDTVGGLKTVLNKQKAEPGKLTISLYHFDTEYFKSLDMADVSTINTDTLLAGVTPRGGTSLLDALYKAIVETGESLSKLPEEQRPEKVLFVVLTDGGENSSREVRREKVKAIIEQQKTVYSWDFSFLGADFDAFTGVGSSLGTQRASTFNYSKRDSHLTFSSAINSGLSCYRSQKTAGKLDLSQIINNETQETGE